MEPSKSLAMEPQFVSLLIPITHSEECIDTTNTPFILLSPGSSGERTSLHPWPSLGRLLAHAVGWNYSLDDLSFMIWEIALL
jgi:hypothetical protein